MDWGEIFLHTSKAERGLPAERLDGNVWLIVANLHVVIENDRRMLENFAAGEGALQYGQEDFDEFASTAALAENWTARLIEATYVED